MGTTVSILLRTASWLRSTECASVVRSIGLCVALSLTGCNPSDDAAGSPKNQNEPSQPAGELDPKDPTDTRALSVEIDPEAKAHEVQVFYATDRESILEDGTISIWSISASPIGAGILTILLIVATIKLRRKVRYGALAFVSLVLVVVFSHAATLEYQRQQRLLEAGDRVYGADRNETDGSPLEMGTCTVTIPPGHVVGRVESPSILRLEFSEDDEKQVVLQSIRQLEKNDYFGKLAECVNASTDQQAFVFIHGYKVSFDDAVKRTAQIAYDLEFDGAPICYSWPSHGNLADYTKDEANVRWSVRHLKDFLAELVERSGALDVHLIAHSMGNRALTEALEMMANQQQTPQPIFSQVIMAAPDVDASMFRDHYAPAVAKVARQVTLYASNNDAALKASAKIHGHTRAGLSGEHLVLIEGVDTIDASLIDTSLIGHSYYGNNPQLIRDMQALVELGEPASRRTWLEEVAHPQSLASWVFRLRSTEN